MNNVLVFTKNTVVFFGLRFIIFVTQIVLIVMMDFFYMNIEVSIGDISPSDNDNVLFF